MDEDAASANPAPYEEPGDIHYQPPRITRLGSLAELTQGGGITTDSDFAGFFPSKS